jgi:hypothetical protein
LLVNFGRQTGQRPDDGYLIVTVAGHPKIIKMKFLAVLSEMSCYLPFVDLIETGKLGGDGHPGRDVPYRRDNISGPSFILNFAMNGSKFWK